MDITLIKDLKSMSKGFNLLFIVLEICRIGNTKEGHDIRLCKAADRSACINFIIYGEIGSYMQPGDICRLTKAHIAGWDGGLAVFMGKSSELGKTGDFCMIFNESINISEINKIMKGPSTAGAGGNNNNNSNVNNNPTQVIEVDG